MARHIYQATHLRQLSPPRPLTQADRDRIATEVKAAHEQVEREIDVARRAAGLSWNRDKWRGPTA